MVSMAGVVVMGIGAQLLAWRLKIPSILLLLLFGFAAGPVTGFLDPDELLGDLLLPIVSISVAIILFDGGLSLRFSELREAGGVVLSLVTAGAMATWLVSSAGAHYLLGFDWALSVLFGAILVVTGPTVIIPLLRQVRPSKRVGAILKWEGIVIDPIGAILAVLVFETLFSRSGTDTVDMALHGVMATVGYGGATGLAAAAFVVIMLRRYWAPDYLQSPLTLAVVVGCFTLSNHLQEESGLLAVTLMGLALANQRWVSVRHIVEFKENLQVLLIAFLFILLAARLSLFDLAYAGWSTLAFVAAVILIARPLSVLLSTIRSPLDWKEKVLLAGIAPRGIVAAAVASVFAIRLQDVNHPDAFRLVPMTFIVIVATVAVYGLGASLLARVLGLSQSNPQGVLIVGAHSWARKLAWALKKEDFAVVLADTNPSNVSAARLDGLIAIHANVLAEHGLNQIDLSGLGRLIAVTSNDEVNMLAALHLSEHFGRQNVYHLALPARSSQFAQTVPKHLSGRSLFGSGLTYAELTRLFARDAAIHTTAITPEFSYSDYRITHGDTAVPLFVVTEKRQLQMATADSPPKPKPGQVLISLIPAPEPGPEQDSAAAGHTV